MHLSATGHSLYDCSHSYFFFSTPVCKTTVIIGVKYRFVNNERAKVDKKVDKCTLVNDVTPTFEK